MRRKTLFWAGVIATLAGFVYAQDAPDPIQEARRMAPGILDGRDLVVRIYPEPQNDPERSVLVTVPIRGLALRFSDIGETHPSISESAYVLICAKDQTDDIVAKTLDRYVCLRAYNEQFEQTIWLLDSRSQFSSSWTVFDAQGEPMVGASVLLELSPSAGPDGVPIRLGSATVDEEGRLPRWLTVGGALTMTVAHPDYGVAAMRRREDPWGICVVPMVRRDAPAFASSIHGTIIDTEGRPVAGVSVFPSMMRLADGDGSRYLQQFDARAVTDDQGRFALCLPIMTEDFALEGFSAPGTPYEITIEPPPSLNLRRLGWPRPLAVSSGTANSFTLTPLEAEKRFHTFAFEYLEGPLTERGELESITLTLWRDNREWSTLTYEQFKNGCVLPPGTLRARTLRWGRPFAFPETQLTPDSPEHIVISAGAPVVYRGQVVCAETEEPMPGVYVVTGRGYGDHDPCALTPEQWQVLANQAAAYARAEPPDRCLYELDNRVTVTDANGSYEVTFLPGLGSWLSGFAALAPGYRRDSVPAPPRESPPGLVKVPSIKLWPEEPGYHPTFVFYDEAGPVTDPNKLSEVWVSIRNGNRSRGVSLESLRRRGALTPGVYYARATWDQKQYAFAPVDLTTQRPETVVFRPQEIRPPTTVYRGLVVNGLSGRPIAGAVVTFHRLRPNTDASRLEPDQWAAIQALGPNPDMNDPALAPLVGLARAGRDSLSACAITDDSGWFGIEIERVQGTPSEVLLVQAQDFLGAQQDLSAPPTGAAGASPYSLRFTPDKDGIVTLPTQKLFPAGTVTICPIVPDSGRSNRRERRIQFLWMTQPDAPIAWSKDLWASPRDNFGASTFYQYELRPNTDQSVYVPAGVTLVLTMYGSILEDALPPQLLGTVSLAQGQTVKLGRVEFAPTLEVIVKAIDSQGRPVPGVSVSCTDEQIGLCLFARDPTDEMGRTSLTVSVHSSGRFVARAVTRLNPTPHDESFPYQVAGTEDAGKEFVLSLSDEMVQLLTAEVSR
jgi:hypothetical protein